MEKSKQSRLRKVDEVLGKVNDMVLSTSDAKGSVRVAIMSYVRPEADILLMSTEPNAVKLVNIKENPKVSMVRFDGCKKPSLLMSGNARILEGGEADRALKTVLSIAPRYGSFTNRNRTFIEVKIETVTYEWYFAPEGEEQFFKIEDYSPENLSAA